MEMRVYLEYTCRCLVELVKRNFFKASEFILTEYFSKKQVFDPESALNMAVNKVQKRQKDFLNSLTSISQPPIVLAPAF